ncbi:MAG TPA: AI-2E family transporter [Streptosporangiaceae bacterium]|nr:AI-2E family transporter [Streptosporangiaceae bacterium]
MDVNPPTPSGEPADGPGDGAADGHGEKADERPPPTVFPPWSSSFVRHAALWLIAAIVGGLFLERLADSLAHRLAGIFQLIVVSLFLSFAIEPAVGWLARRGWRRGAATGLIFLGVVAVGAGLLALLIPALVTGSRQLITALPDLLNNLAKYLKPLGIKLDRASLEKQVTTYSDDLISAAKQVTGGILHLAATLAGTLFEVSVVAFFTFYMVAQGPQLRRVVLSRFRPRRQRQILEVWEEAIRQTGGYFYSRLLIAVINGSLMFLVLWIRNVPFAAPLAVFEAAVATFIPAIGTYIGGAAPVAGALLVSPLDAVIALAWIIVYQQIENYLLAPKLTARTMDVSAPIAFAAALIGGALGGFLFAFLSLPVAGIIQSVIRSYGHRYEVIDEAGTGDQAVDRT